MHPRSPLSPPPLHPPVVTALCHWQRTFARLRVVLAYFSSRIRNVPCLWFFRFFLYLVPQYFSNSPNMLVRKTHSSCGDVRAISPTWVYFLYRSMHLCVSFSSTPSFLIPQGIVPIEIAVKERNIFLNQINKIRFLCWWNSLNKIIFLLNKITCYIISLIVIIVISQFVHIYIISLLILNDGCKHHIKMRIVYDI